MGKGAVTDTMRVRIDDCALKDGTLVAKVKNESDVGLSVSLRDYSTKTAADGFDDAVVFIEFNDGKPMLYVWSDINKEDPTHIIDLSGAHINRRLTTFKGHYYAKDDRGAKTLISEFEIQAANANDLERKLLDLFWDDRLDAASCVPWPEYEIVS